MEFKTGFLQTLKTLLLTHDLNFHSNPVAPSTSSVNSGQSQFCSVGRGAHFITAQPLAKLQTVLPFGLGCVSLHNLQAKTCTKLYHHLSYYQVIIGIRSVTLVYQLLYRHLAFVEYDVIKSNNRNLLI